MRKINVFTKVYWLDKKRCRHTGCRKRIGLEIHHIIARSQGGLDKVENLITLCSFHHNLITSKKLTNIDLLTKYLKTNGTKFRWKNSLNWHISRKDLKEL